MSVPYDRFAEAFLAKVSEYDFLQLSEYDRTHLVDGYMKRAISAFRKNCKYNFMTTADDIAREYLVDVDDEDLDEIVDIVSEGMVVQWLRQFVNSQENLQLVLNSRDFTTYSSAELLNRINGTYTEARKNFINAMREYSYNHGDLEV